MDNEKPVNLRFDGLYQSEPYTVSGKSGWQFLRFYQDGCVLSVSTLDVNMERISKLLSKEVIARSSEARNSFSRGRYTFKQARLRYWVKGQRGRHDYTGEFRSDKLTITNKDGAQRELSFCPIADYEQGPEKP
jgi:hypothetical protein